MNSGGKLYENSELMPSNPYGETKLAIEKILSEYIGKKIMDLEIEKLKIIVNDNSLRNILKNDKLFSKDKEFSRTEYEKFLITSGITAPQFEAIIAEQEKKKPISQFFSRRNSDSKNFS